MSCIFCLRRACYVVIGAALLVQCVIARGDELYHERLRPQFHFTAAKDYINDPNGLFYLDGTYHLFFQTGPISAKRWGHAISKDLLHWKQLDDALKPMDGHPAFSGCAVVDHNNTSALQTGDNPPVVAVFTSWGEGQCLAYSNDNGLTWQRYEKNPVLALAKDSMRSFPLSARDPHVMWDVNRNRWVMVLYDNLNDEQIKGVSRHEQGGFSIFTSPDLKRWTRQSHLPGFYVCPDVFELPIEDEDESTWIAMDWAQYTTGDFDGTKFTPDAEPLPLDFGNRDTLSANQSWKHLPDRRVVQICWIRGGKYPGMPFDQQHSFPTSLSLRRVGDRVRLCKQPIKEITKLYSGEIIRENVTVSRSKDIELSSNSHSYDLQLDFDDEFSGALIFDVLGQPVLVRRDSIRVGDKVLRLEEPVSQLRILADVTSIEVFVNHGLATMTFTAVPPNSPQPIRLSAIEGSVVLKQASLHLVQSIWKHPEFALRKNADSN